MALWQGRSGRKKTGGRYRPIRKKRRFEIGREKQYSIIGERSVKKVRTRGNNRKAKLLSDQTANVLDPETHKTTRSKILDVVENPADPNYVRRNIVTKGALVQTEKGYARITSRPGQIGYMNAVKVSYTPQTGKKRRRKLKKKKVSEN